MNQESPKEITFFKTYNLASDGVYNLKSEETEEGFIFTLTLLKEPLIE